MSTVFTIIVFGGLIATCYYTIRFAIGFFRPTTNKRFGRSSLISLAVMIAAVIGVGVTAPTTDLSATQAKTQLQKAMATHQTLTAEARSAHKQQAKLTAEKAALIAAVTKAEAAEAKAQSQKKAEASASSSRAEAAASASREAASQASVQAASASSESAKQASVAAEQAASQSRAAAANQAQAPVNNGDMNTAAGGQIVGNARSKIYHVPGQAGYRMNSANAVYFNTESEAQAAGYRKSMR